MKLVSIEKYLSFIVQHSNMSRSVTIYILTVESFHELLMLLKITIEMKLMDNIRAVSTFEIPEPLKRK